MAALMFWPLGLLALLVIMVRSSNTPTRNPTIRPTISRAPTFFPTRRPTFHPTLRPSVSPTYRPSIRPSLAPSRRPTNRPTSRPTASPTALPTSRPTSRPTYSPSSSPSVAPTPFPTSPTPSAKRLSGGAIAAIVLFCVIMAAFSMYYLSGSYPAVRNLLTMYIGKYVSIHDDDDRNSRRSKSRNMDIDMDSDELTHNPLNQRLEEEEAPEFDERKKVSTKEIVKSALDSKKDQPLTLFGLPVSKQVFGTSICLLGVLVVSPDSLLLQLVVSDVPLWSIVLFRYLFLTIACCLVLLWRDRSRSWNTITSTGKLGVLSAFAWGISNFLITVALLVADAANCLVILAANPMFSALFSYFILKEVAKIHTILASLVCFGAILLIFFTAQQGNSSAASPDEDASVAVLGTFCALGACISQSLYFTLLRIAEEKDGVEPDYLVMNIIAGSFVSLMSLCLTDGNFGRISGANWGFLLINGGLVLPLAFVMLSIGPQYIPAAEVSLCTLLETALGPLWVYLGGFETPSVYAIGGGAALIVSLAIHSLLGLYEEEQQHHIKKVHAVTALDDSSEEGDGNSIL